MADIGQKRIYSKAFQNRNDVVLWDVLAVSNIQQMRFVFVSKNSQARQGVRLAIDSGDGYIEINGIQNRSIMLWEDTAPNVVYLKCVTSMGLLSIYNIFDRGNGMKSQVHGSGMLVEEIDNVFVYRCNDYELEENFDKLIFSIALLPDSR